MQKAYNHFYIISRSYRETICTFQNYYIFNTITYFYYTAELIIQLSERMICQSRQYRTERKLTQETPKTELHNWKIELESRLVALA